MQATEHAQDSVPVRVPVQDSVQVPDSALAQIPELVQDSVQALVTD